MFPQSIDKVENKEKLAIVCVGYNRLNSLKRLLNSLLQANYQSNDIPLVISIDCSGDKAVYDYAISFEWPYGEKYVNIESSRLGLKEHIFQCGDLSFYFKGVIILEDDIYVSPSFYNYTLAAVDKYGDNPNIAGISLFSSDFNGWVGLPFIPLKTESDVFAYQSVISWGQCWTTSMWEGFKNWYLNNKNINMSQFDMPHCIKTWSKAWSKYFYCYILSKDLYFIMPYDSFTTNFSEEGEHNSGKFINHQVQTRLLYGNKIEYLMHDFDTLFKYDVFQNPKELSKYLGISEDELCVDFYGNRPINKRYILSPFKLSYNVIGSWGMYLRPLEFNIIRNISGNDIYLYDSDCSRAVNRNINIEYLSFLLKGFNLKLLCRYLLLMISLKIKNKIIKHLT